MTRIAVIGDSISSRNNGAASHCWPELLDSMIQSLGVHGVTVQNYALPGLTYKTAHTHTPGWLIGGMLSPLDAVLRDGCDMLIVCLGANDRQNPSAIVDALALQSALPDVRVVWARQSMFDSTGSNDSVVTQAEQQAMDDVYSALGGDGFAIGLGKLYDMGYSYDMLHPTNSGKQWIASAVYMYLQSILPLTPIYRNIAWLYAQSPQVREQMRRAST
jgi:lysophospholipase L1-like esterase